MPKSKSQKSKTKARKSQKKSTTKSKSNSSLTCPPGMEKVKTNKNILCVGRCPHSGGPIYYNPKLDKLVCKWHGSQFSLSGKVETPPANKNLKIKRQ